MTTERIYIRVNATRTASATWGDTQFAQGLERALNRLPGCDCRLLYRGERPEQSGIPSALVQIVGPHLEEPVPGLPNLLWMISPPNVAPLPMLARYQAVFVAAEHQARQMQRRGVAAEYLPQATEIGHFHPSRRPGGAGDIPVVFVGSFATRVGRRIVLDAVDMGFEPRIWGPGWRGVVPDHLWCGERLDFDQLAETYARARIVLNSHMTSMAKLGFMSNRSYDALACGATVVSDFVMGFSDPSMPEIFQVAGRDELRTTLRTLIDAPPADHAARLALHERLARQHGFEARASVILDRVRALLADGSVAQPAFSPGRSWSVGTNAPPRRTVRARAAARSPKACCPPRRTSSALPGIWNSPTRPRRLPQVRRIPTRRTALSMRFPPIWPRCARLPGRGPPPPPRRATGWLILQAGRAG